METNIDNQNQMLLGTQIIWTIITCWIISSFNGGFVTLLPYSSWILVFPIWFIFSSIINPAFVSYLLKTGWTIIAFELCVILFSVLDSTAINVTSRSFMGIIVSYSIFCFIYTYPRDWSKPIVKFYFIEVFCQIVYAIHMLIKYPILIRKLLTSSVDGSNYPFMISFAGIYVSMAIMLYIIVQFKYIKRRYKFLCFTMVVLQYILVFMSNLATPLIICSIFVGISFVIKSRIKLIFSFMLIGIIYVIFKNEIGNIFVNLSTEKFFSVIISDKLKELGYHLQGIIVVNANGTYAIRQKLMKESMRTFSQHFLLGVYGMGYDVKVGGHTTWQDLLGNFGVIRSIPLVMFLSYWFFKLKTEFIKEQEKNSAFYAILIILIAGFFNPVFKLAISSFIFLIMPITGRVLCNYKSERKVIK